MLLFPFSFLNVIKRIISLGADLDISELDIIEARKTNKNHKIVDYFVLERNKFIEKTKEKINIYLQKYFKNKEYLEDISVNSKNADGEYIIHIYSGAHYSSTDFFLGKKGNTYYIKKIIFNQGM